MTQYMNLTRPTGSAHVVEVAEASPAHPTPAAHNVDVPQISFHLALSLGIFGKSISYVTDLLQIHII